MLKKAVDCLIADKGFQLKSVPTATCGALSTAIKLKEWMEVMENTEDLDRFSSELVADLRQCLPQLNGEALTKVKKETMWRMFYQYRI